MLAACTQDLLLHILFAAPVSTTPLGRNAALSTLWVPPLPNTPASELAASSPEALLLLLLLERSSRQNLMWFWPNVTSLHRHSQPGEVWVCRADGFRRLVWCRDDSKLHCNKRWHFNWLTK